MKRKQERDEFDRMGLVVHESWAMFWSMKHGRLRWAPHWVRSAIVTTWNWVVCRLFGHDRSLASIPECWAKDGTFHCVNCCKPLNLTVGEISAAMPKRKKRK